MDEFLFTIVVCGGLLIVGLLFRSFRYFFKYILKPKTSQDSYHYYLEFIKEEHVPGMDDKFKEKLNIIEHSIKNGEENIKKIAKLSKCSYEECVLKIKYLETQNRLPNMHIDYKTDRVLKCSKDDTLLLKQYLPYLRSRRLTLDEIATKKRVSSMQDYETLKNKVFEDLKYLVDNDLISWIKLNEVDKEIIYFSENKKQNLKKITCPNCGAANEIHNHDKVRCAYCDTILEIKNKSS